MLRGPLGYQIIEAISQILTIQSLGLKNNFLGQKGTCVEEPVCLLANMLINSKFLENLDLGYN